MQTDSLLNQPSAREMDLAPSRYGAWTQEMPINAPRPPFERLTIALHWGTVLLCWSRDAATATSRRNATMRRIRPASPSHHFGGVVQFRSYPNSGQTRALSVCPLSARSGQKEAAN